MFGVVQSCAGVELVQVQNLPGAWCCPSANLVSTYNCGSTALAALL